MDAIHDGAKTAKDDPSQLRPGLKDRGSSGGGGGGGSEGGGKTAATEGTAVGAVM